MNFYFVRLSHVKSIESKKILLFDVQSKIPIFAIWKQQDKSVLPK